MTFYVTALTNDKAKLIVSELRVSGRHAEQTAIEVRKMWVKLGYDVITRTEG